ncbi:MAG TPA: GDSL-type esterase/lipase family protein [Candidatus Nanoarchaeia archaeon]|nr:GDSL-type esterase/lipase family protein [Candidatus Nanoarchaeia archaeon]
MRKIIFKEWFFLFWGLVIILVDLFVLKTPPTLRRINLLEGYIFQGLIFIAGLFLIVFSLVSISKKEHLFSQPKIKQFLTNLRVLFLSILFCLIFLEVFLQLTAPEGCGQDDAILHHSYQPNCSVNSKSAEWNIDVKINSDSFRDEEIQPKQNYDYRILMLGDSFTVGWGIEQGQTFSDLLEIKFNQKQLKVDVINGGATSYSPILGYLFLKDKSVQYDSDLIILNFDLSDFQNDYSYQKLARYDVSGKIIGVTPERDNFLKSIYLNVKLIKFLESPFVVLDSKFPTKKLWGKKYFYNIDYDRYALTRSDVPEEIMDKYTETSFKYLKLIQQLASEKNITFILVAYPYGHQVSGEEWAKGRHNYGFEQGKVYSDLPERLLAQFAAENNIQFIGLYPEFKESGQFPLFYPYDGHLTPAGHQLYADSLYAKLLEKGILKDISTKKKSLTKVLQEKAVNPLFIGEVYANLQKD